jgi:magnesium-transporting ATPase (P-type)
VCQPDSALRASPVTQALSEKMNLEILIPILVFMTFFQIFCMYISPYSSESATPTKRLLAVAWVVLRRIICSIAVILFVLGIYHVWQSPKELSTLFRAGVSFIILLMMVLVVWVGAVGKVSRWSTITSDISQYKKVKAKYNVR